MKLLSAEFLLFSISMIILVNLLGGKPRQLTYLIGNLLFVTVLVLEPIGALSTVAFCLVGYLFIRLIERSPTWGFWCGLAILIAAFLYMRDYTFLHLMLPDSWRTSYFKTIGLSFVLFRTIHMMVEARSKTLGRYDLISYLNYNLSFTTFLSGPIQRYQDFRDQWEGTSNAIPLTLSAHLDAVIRILLGMVKVYIIGDRLLELTLGQYPSIASLTYGQTLLGCYIFYPFLYFNFSGYCDIVIGIGSLLGIRPPENFDRPFLATNISEYWLRVHRSLTLWLTDYVFSPLYKLGLESETSGRYPLLVMIGALFITMIVCGLWHGTTGSFIVFGLLHGCYLVVFRLWDHLISKRLGKQRVRALRKHWLVQSVGIILTFHAAALAYLFFDLEVPSAFLAVKKILFL